MRDCPHSFTRRRDWGAAGVLLLAQCQCRAVLKGPLDGDATLCTVDNTYSLKSVETTNTLLLVNDGEVGAPGLSLPGVSANGRRPHRPVRRSCAPKAAKQG